MAVYWSYRRNDRLPEPLWVSIFLQMIPLICGITSYLVRLLGTSSLLYWLSYGNFPSSERYYHCRTSEMYVSLIEYSNLSYVSSANMWPPSLPTLFIQVADRIAGSRQSIVWTRRYTSMYNLSYHIIFSGIHEIYIHIPSAKKFSKVLLS